MNVVVVSPHLDDGVLSLGATINKLARQGENVRLVTVFAGNPDNDGPPSPWDAHRGTQTAAEVVATRRAEDACAADVLGIEAAWLPFDDDQHLTARDPDAIWEALEPQLVGADRIYVPGWPLEHYDHRYTTMLTIARLRSSAALWGYCESPYALAPVSRVKAVLRGRSVPAVESAIEGELSWSTQDVSRADILNKVKALECYVGEMVALGWNVPLSPLQRWSLRVEKTGEMAIRRPVDSADPAGGE